MLLHSFCIMTTYNATSKYLYVSPYDGVPVSVVPSPMGCTWYTGKVHLAHDRVYDVAFAHTGKRLLARPTREYKEARFAQFFRIGYGDELPPGRVIEVHNYKFVGK